MPPRAKPFDLKNALEPQAIEWLKAARYKLMRDLEQEYYKLERARDTPMSQPAWALDPAQAIFLQPVPLPTVLNAYCPAIHCGFNHCSSPALDPSWMFFQIHFPAQVAAAPPPPQQPPPLYVKDEFSRLAKGGAVKSHPGVGGFSGSNFARLLTDARGENGNGAGDSPDDDDTAAGPSKKRRRTSRIAKEESDDEEARLGLRSVARASSAATLRESNSVNTRRSGRKRVKREE
ncbi:hypothetical protein B0H13DRAFT_1963721 [Mycena leptocephala]|nr:hypothetical protein B0H13DRAFT_1963721 [Mycena leptocephala]